MKTYSIYRNKSIAELEYIIKDASEAAECMKGFDDTAELKYIDQVNEASSELYRRKNLVRKEIRRKV